MAKRRDVKFVQNAVILDGETYTLEGCEPKTFWRLALEGLVARLKRTKDPRGTWKAITEGGIVRQKRKVDPVVKAMAEIRAITEEEAQAMWDGYDREQRAKIRSHPAVYSVVHKEAGGLDALLQNKSG
jgi:hypothetical protein